jgi:phosphate transport system substrate-binding protein
MYPKIFSRVNFFSFVPTALLTVAIFLVVACGESDKSKVDAKEIESSQSASKALSGLIEIDGSSTVFPITQAVAEEFNKIHQEVQIPVGVSGTGGGMKRFTVGETSISDASRPIKDKEANATKENGIDFVEVTVAYDGLSIMVNLKNTWVECLTIEHLNKLWRPDNPVNKWNELDPSWPDKTINLYGPGTDSGTFDYFTNEVNGDEGVSRADFVASEDDNVLVIGIAGDKNALGYFGYAYYIENKDKLKIIPIDGGTGCITPSIDTIANGTYKPLSRPLFIYVNTDHLVNRTEVSAFLDFYLNEGRPLVAEVGYVPLPDSEYDEQIKKVLSSMK